MLKKAIILIVVIFVFITATFYAYSKLILDKTSPNNNESASVDNSVPDKLPGDIPVHQSKKDRLNLPSQDGLALVGYFSGPEDFSIEDIRYSDDIRGVYPYKDKTIVVAYPKIVEYDFDNNELSRISTDKIKCALSGTVFDGALYVSCNPDYGKGGAYIQKIDLASGEIILDQQGIGEYEVINPTFMVTDDTLYLSSRDGVFQLSTDFDIEDIYTTGDIGFVDCNDSNVMYFEDNGVYAFCNTSDEVFLLNTTEGSWDPVEGLEVEFGDYYNLKAEDYNIDLPFFFASSELVNNKKYVLSTQGVSVLYKDSMPEMLFTVDLSDYMISMGDFPPGVYSLYVNDAEYYALLVIREVYQGPGSGFGETRLISIDLVDETVSDLTKDISRDEREELLKLLTASYELESLDFTSLNDFEIMVSYDGNDVISVDLGNSEYAVVIE